MSKPVIYAQLHEVFFVPGQKNGNLGPTLNPSTMKTDYKNFSMALEDSVLVLSWESGNMLHSCSLGPAMYKVAVHAPTEILKPAVASAIPVAA